MNDKVKSVFKVLRVVLVVAALGFGVYLTIVTIGVMAVFIRASDHTELYGDIIAPSQVVVGEPIPLEFVAPEELEGIHGLMWDAKYEGDENMDYDNLYENEAMLSIYTEDELKALFDKDTLNYEYLALYVPPKSGSITFELFGFYRQTNPQGITYLEVTVNEKGSD